MSLAVSEVVLNGTLDLLPQIKMISTKAQGLPIEDDVLVLLLQEKLRVNNSEISLYQHDSSSLKS